MRSKLVFFSSSVLAASAISSITVSSVAYSQEQESSSQNEKTVQLQDVIITGTKAGEVDLQSVPSAITVFTAEDISEAGIDSIEDLRLQTPGLNLTRNGQATRLYMRGIGSNLDFIGSDPSVTVHVDGVYQPRTTTVLDSFLDIEQVEVLRGPQGTLYGRNSTGGTIHIKSKLPEKETESTVFGELGNYSHYRFGGAVSGEITDDVLGRVSFMRTGHDPYVKNTADNDAEGLQDDNSWSSRGTLRFLLTDKSELILRADYSDVDRQPAAYKPTGLTTTGAPSPSSGALVQTNDPWEMATDFEEAFVENTHWGTSVEFAHQLNDQFKLVSLTAYRDLEFETNEDTDGSNLSILMTELAEEQNQITEELRLHYSDDKLHAVVGGYYLSEEQETDTVVNIYTVPTSVVLDAKNEVTAYALFGQGTYAITNRLNGTLGLRYSREEKDFRNTRNNNAGPAGYLVDEKQDWDSWSPKLGLDYTTNSGALVYGTVSRGFKSGGFNMTAEDAEFDPEKVWSYEIGTKMDLLNKTLRSNVSVFYYDYKDLQVQNFIVPGVIFIENAADATIKGFEVENQWMPTYDWMFELDYAFLDAEYDNYIFGTQDVSGDDMVASPEHKVNLSVQFYQDIDAGMLTYRVGYAWQDDQYFTAPNQDVSFQENYGLWNARVSFRTLDEKTEVQLYGENLGDKTYSTSSREFPATSVGVTKDIGAPLTAGVRLIHHFD